MSAQLPAFKDSEVLKRPADFVPPTVDPRVNPKGQSEFAIRNFQASSLNEPATMQPASIISPADGNIADVQLAVQFAHANGLAVSCRSGGHQFSGFSSTCGDNLQLDMSRFNACVFNEADQTFTIGTGCILNKAQDAMAAKECFVPHGQCGSVGMGGHLSTGGYSPYCSRSFGYLIDHISKFRIVLAPKAKGSEAPLVTVVKPVKGETTLDNDDLWNNVLGASPGGFGVLIDATVVPLWDKDHADNRTYQHVVMYTKEKWEKILAYALMIGADDDLGADFNINVAMMGAFAIKMVLITASWCNIKGAADPYDKNVRAQEFFGGLQNLVDGMQGALERLEIKAMFEGIYLWTGFRYIYLIDYNEPTAPSVNNGKLTFSRLSKTKEDPTAGDGEAGHFVSQCQIGAQDLTATGFNAWVSDILERTSHTDGLGPSLEYCVIGGKHSRMRLENSGNTGNAPRRNVENFSLTQCTYKTPADKAKAFAFIDEVSKGTPKNYGIDSRWMAFNPTRDVNLDELKEFYFDDEAQYQRVLKFKREVDPQDVFTANPFGVGASRKFGNGANCAA